MGVYAMRGAWTCIADGASSFVHTFTKGGTVRRLIGLIAATTLLIAPFAVDAPVSVADPSIPQALADGHLRPAVMHVNGITKRLPGISGGIVATAQEALGVSASGASGSASRVPGAEVTSLGCGGRAGNRNVRVNQDCTYRRQAETDIAFNPTDHSNLVAGMNDSLVGWNKTSLDFSLDGGAHSGRHQHGAVLVPAERAGDAGADPSRPEQPHARRNARHAALI